MNFRSPSIARPSIAQLLLLATIASCGESSLGSNKSSDGGAGTTGAAGASAAGGTSGATDASGSAGSNGPAGATGASGSNGTAGAAGSTTGAGGGNATDGGRGDAGGETCATLMADYDAAFKEARKCIPGQSAATLCAATARPSLSCSCPTHVQSTTKLDQIHAQWDAAGCTTPGVCLPVCLSPGTGVCSPDTSSGGVCTDKL